MCRVYNIEVASKAPIRFRFPMFQTIHWFAAERLVEDLRDMSRKGSRCPEQLIRGVRALATALRNWTLEKDVRIKALKVSKILIHYVFCFSSYEAERKRKK